MIGREIKKKIDAVGYGTKVCVGVTAAAAVITLSWQLIAEPCIQRQIDNSTTPIIDVLEYQTYLMMQTLTDEQLKKANDGYAAGEKMRVRRR